MRWASMLGELMCCGSVSTVTLDERKLGGAVHAILRPVPAGLGAIQLLGLDLLADRDSRTRMRYHHSSVKNQGSTMKTDGLHASRYEAATAARAIASSSVMSS